MSSIIVGVRVRPFNQRELKYNSVNIVSMNLSTNCIALTQVRQGKVLKDEKPKEFFFDHALWTHDTTTVEPVADQAYCYEKMGRPVLENVLSGYNACLFAYGQTGSGKTYSMMGYGPDAGVTPRLCDELFKTAFDLQEQGAVATKDGLTTTTITVEASYLEIYNEIVKDLLAVKGTEGESLKIRQHPKTGVFVEGLRKLSVQSKDGIVELLDEGQTLRSVAATQMNATSSRSHAILMLTITRTSTTVSDQDGKEVTTTSVKTGKLSLVDLAGSERAASTGATGDTLTEGANINKSLSFLGMCLSRLAEIAEKGEKAGHIPFRDSSLTFLLSENLGGNSKTSMLANISPAEINFDETLSTLRFAQVTKKVKNHAVVNENPTAKLIRELKEELDQLKAELKAAHERRPAVLTQQTEADDSQTLPDGEQLPATANEEQELLQRLQDSEAAAQALEEAAETAEKVEIDDDHAVKKTSLFVDWRRPQLVNLCPEGTSLVLPVADGPTTYTVDPAVASTSVKTSREFVDNVFPSTTRTLSFTIDFNPLLNTAKLVFAVACVGSSVPAVVPSINGDILDPSESSVKESAVPRDDGDAVDALVERRTEIKYVATLAHSDRIVFGRAAFRFSHSSSLPSMPEYSEVPQSIEHLLLLEAFERERVQETFAESMRNVLNECGDEDRSMELHRDDSEIRELVEDYIASSRAQRRQHEERLVADYPITIEEQNAALAEWRASKHGHASGVETSEENDYSAVVDEAKRGLEAKNEMIQKLRRELEAAAAHRRKRELSMVRHAAEAEERRRKAEDEAVLAKAVQEELQWHAELRKIRKPSASGPAATEDHAVWQRLASGKSSDMPFLQQLMMDVVNEMPNQPSTGSQQVLAATEDNSLPVSHCGVFFKQKQKSKAFEERFGVLLGRFLYYFARCDGRERCKGAFYLYGATIAKLSPQIEKDLGRKNCVLLTTVCPRRPGDSSSFYLSFPTQNDLSTWEKWISERAAPPMPKCMRERIAEQHEQEVLEGKRQPTNDAVSGSVTLGKAGKFNWKNESTVANCEHCNASFGLFTRKHHCNVCGGIFCDSCAPKVKGDERQCGMCREYGTQRPVAEGGDFDILDEDC